MKEQLIINIENDGLFFWASFSDFIDPHHSPQGYGKTAKEAIIELLDAYLEERNPLKK